MPLEEITAIASFISIFVVGSIGYSRGAVDRSGLLAGIFVGLLFALSGGLAAVAMLLTFFTIGSIFTKYKYSYKERIGVAEPRGGARGWRSVFSNLFFPSLALLLHYFTEKHIYFIAFLSSISCSLADTLASELGSLDKRGPWLIRNFRKVPHGTSGAISIIGTASGFLGSFLIPFEALMLNMISFNSFLLASSLGFISSILDSLLGATVQAKYFCESEGRVIEDPSVCEGRCLRLSGLPWVDNHTVNLISTGLGSFLAIALGGGML